MRHDPLADVFAVADELYAMHTDGDIEMVAMTDRHAALIRDDLRLYGVDTSDPRAVRAVAATWSVLAGLVDRAFENHGVECPEGGHNDARHAADSAMQAFGIALRQLNNSAQDAAALAELDS